MNIDFALILTIAVFITGIIALMDQFWFSKKRAAGGAPNIIIEYSRSLFPIFLLVLVIRSFIAEPFRIPSGSLEPSLLPGDFIVANKFAYGLRLPVINTKIFNLSEPKVGQIVVFRWPVNPSIDYIKRVIGVPGDHISYIDKVLYINGKQATQKPIGYALDTDGNGSAWIVEKVEENIQGVKHDIYINPKQPAVNFTNLVVPKGMYFMMGDNRDDSYDSRYWGFAPEKNLIGKAFVIFFSWNKDRDNVRWSRLGQWIG
jgi:signal peptidase I